MQIKVQIKMNTDGRSGAEQRTATNKHDKQRHTNNTHRNENENEHGIKFKS